MNRYTQEDFDQLAALGANYVNISHPGLFIKTPPYTLDQDVQDNLDHLLDMIAQADMFAVISFRTGPGRAAASSPCSTVSTACTPSNRTTLQAPSSLTPGSTGLTSRRTWTNCTTSWLNTGHGWQPPSRTDGICETGWPG